VQPDDVLGVPRDAIGCGDVRGDDRIDGWVDGWVDD